MLEEQVSHKAILFVVSLAARESKRIFMRFRNVTRSTSLLEQRGKVCKQLPIG